MSLITVSGATNGPNAVEGTVYYFGFEIERITGILEQEMEKNGCLYSISRQKFTSLLQEDIALGQKYNRRNVRAKVAFENEEPYFVSRQGVVRQGRKFFTLGKRDFVRSLSPVKGKCM